MNLLWILLDLVLGVLLIMLARRSPAGKRLIIGIGVAVLALSVAIGIVQQLAP